MIINYINIENNIKYIINIKETLKKVSSVKLEI